MRHLASALLVLAFVAVAIGPSTAQGPPPGGQGAAAVPGGGQAPGGAGGRGGRGRGMAPSGSEAPRRRRQPPRTRIPPGRRRGPRGEIRIFRANTPPTTCAACRGAAGGAGQSRIADPRRVPAACQRRRSQQLQRGEQETFLRNEFGIRTFGYTSIIIEPANGRRPAVTAGAGASEGAGWRRHVRHVPLDGFDDFSLYDRCITRGIRASPRCSTATASASSRARPRW